MSDRMNKKVKLLIISMVIVGVISGGVSYGISKYVLQVKHKATKEAKIAMQKEQEEKENTERQKKEKDKAEEEKKKKEAEKKQQEQEIEKEKQTELKQTEQVRKQQVEQEKITQEEKIAIGEEIREKVDNGYFPSDEEFRSFIIHSFANHMEGNEVQLAQYAHANNKTVTERSFDDLSNQLLEEVKTTEFYKDKNVRGIMAYILEQTPNFLLNNFWVNK